MAMALVPAAWDGRQYINPVPTQGCWVLSHVQDRPAFLLRSRDAFAQAHADRAPKEMFSGPSQLVVHEVLLSTDDNDRVPGQ